ncbi:MAG: hypothetical protein AMJ88_11475 [Anaerolineae bacterium SM23_ 63]|nr:MAG: hypothetical protein AMJ88_11475 [Anaerolineae bacterium SM23_ 63]HEY46131.1 hypothetical protein [Anaerolineae bacterium]
MTEEHNTVHDLETQIWIRQFIVETECADEYVDLYESLGNEARVEPVTPDLMVADECATCLLVTCDRYVVIYTRPREDKHGSEV